MGFIPEDKEERKWFYRVTVLGVVLYYFLHFLLAIYKPAIITYYSSTHESYYLSLYFFAFSSSYFFLGTLLGFLTNLKVDQVSTVFVRGASVFFLFFFIIINLWGGLLLGTTDPKGTFLVLLFSVFYIIGGIAGAKINLFLKNST